MLDEAKQLVELGLPIIPLCSYDHAGASQKHIQRCKCPGKTPLIKDWQDHDTTNLVDIQSWTNSFKKWNIGLPLGDASGYCGIDVDGDEGIQLLQEMSQGDLPSTWEYSTGAGHRLLYLIPAGLKTKKFKQTGQGAHQECALLCTGQQTVLPPSIHHSGARYEWVTGHSPWEMDCAIAPSWLVDKIKLDESPTKTSDFSINFDVPSGTVNFADEFGTVTDFQTDIPENVDVKKKKAKGQGKTGHKIVVTDEMLQQPIPEGSRDNTMTAIVGHYCANRDLRRFGKDFIMNICLQHNEKYCMPPLDEQAIRDKVDYFFEAEQLKDAEFSEKKKQTFEASKMAKSVIQYLLNGGVYLHFDQFSRIYYYTTDEQGPWHATRNYGLIDKWIRDVLTSPHYGAPNFDKRSYVDETRKAIEEYYTAAYKTTDDFDLGSHQRDLRDYIVVNNGMVEWQTGELIPWDPEVKTTISFDLDYEPTATCPNFEKYLQDWLPDESVRKVMQEYLGYCLIPNTNYRKAMFLYGRGKNGKSMLIEFLQDFFGVHSATLSYDGLFTRFGPATLKDKLVNIFDDTTVSFTKETSIAKNLIAGGTISAEFKGRDMFHFQNVARLIFSSQETPRTSDNSIAWRDRWFFVKFPNEFRPSNKVKTEIQKNLQKEKAGIFNWMLEGLRRLMTNDDFTPSTELDLTTQEYQSQNDNVAQFVHNVCSVDTEKTPTSLNDLYKVYQIWAENESLRAVSKKVFSQRINDMGFERDKTYLNGKSGQTYFKTLVLDPTAEAYQEISFEISIAFASR